MFTVSSPSVVKLRDESSSGVLHLLPLEFLVDRLDKQDGRPCRKMIQNIYKPYYISLVHIPHCEHASFGAGRLTNCLIDSVQRSE